MMPFCPGFVKTISRLERIVELIAVSGCSDIRQASGQPSSYCLSKPELNRLDCQQAVVYVEYSKNGKSRRAGKISQTKLNAAGQVTWQA